MNAHLVLKPFRLYTWSTNKFHPANQIDRAGNTLFIITDRLVRNYVPSLEHR